MGFSESEVNWVSVPFNSSYAPGPKDFDFDINNISVTEERDQAVDFSDSYYDLTQALMVLKGSPIEHATTMDEIKDAVFGAQIGTTSLTFINTVIQPTKDPKVFDSTSDAKAALRNGTVDGLVLDLPTAYFEAYDQHAERRPRGPVPERGGVPRDPLRGGESARGVREPRDRRDDRRRHLAAAPERVAGRLPGRPSDPVGDRRGSP